MNIVIGKKDERMRLFLKKLPKENTYVTSSICNFKHIKEEVIVYVPYTCICRNGLFYQTNVFLEELLVTLKVKEIIIGDKCNERILKEICAYHQVPYRYEQP